MPKKLKMGRRPQKARLETQFPIRPPKGFRKKLKALAGHYGRNYMAEVIVMLVDREHETLFPTPKPSEV